MKITIHFAVEWSGVERSALSVQLMPSSAALGATTDQAVLYTLSRSLWNPWVARVRVSELGFENVCDELLVVGA
jgi:hypothetical protein